MGTIDWPASYELAAGLRFVEELRSTTRVAYVAGRSVFVRRAGARERRRLALEGNRSVASPLVFSPDGRTLYHSHAQLQAIDVRTGRRRPVTAFAEADQFGVSWDLQISPDGRTLYFRHAPTPSGQAPWSARLCAVDVDGGDVRVVFAAGPGAGQLWRASCDFARGTADLVVTSSSGLRPLTIDLDGRNLRDRPVVRYGAPDPSADTLDLPYGDVVAIPRDTGDSEALSWRTAAALAPDRRSVAFIRDEHELWHWRFDEPHARCLVRARSGTQLDPTGGWSVAPSFSPDGTLVWFSSTTSKRIEANHWTTRHRVGFVDLPSGEVWMRRGHWRGLAWSGA